MQRQTDPNGIEQHAPGAKLDAGKEPMRLILHAMREGIEQHDEESGLLHAAQVAWNALARLELMLQQSSKVSRNERA